MGEYLIKIQKDNGEEDYINVFADSTRAAKRKAISYAKKKLGVKEPKILDFGKAFDIKETKLFKELSKEKEEK